MLNKLFLDVSPVIDIQLQIQCCRLHVVMAQMVLDVGYRFALIEQIHSPGMAEAVDRTYCFESFVGQHHRQVFFTYSVNAVPGQALSPLTDE